MSGIEQSLDTFQDPELQCLQCSGSVWFAPTADSGVSVARRALSQI